MTPDKVLAIETSNKNKKLWFYPKLCIIFLKMRECLLAQVDAHDKSFFVVVCVCVLAVYLLTSLLPPPLLGFDTSDLL